MSDVLNKKLSRREVLSLGGVGAVGLAGGTYTFNLYRSAFFDELKVAQYHVKSPRWPHDLPTLKIAFLSDLHVGCLSVGLEQVEKIVKQINALKPDIILLGGDFLTSRLKEINHTYIEPAAIAEKLRPLDAPLGVFSVLGNHDWGADGQGIWNALLNNGITVLENQSIYIPVEKSGFHLVGLADYLTRYPAYKKTVAEITDDRPIIVLSHDPYTFKEMPNNVLIQLSGHTHGGQVSLPVIGPIINPTPGAPLRWLYGHIIENDRQMIITSGVGTSTLPIKNTPCELVLLTLETSATLTS